MKSSSRAVAVSLAVAVLSFGTCAAASVVNKELADGEPVNGSEPLRWLVVTAGTDQMGGSFYVQDPERTCGIRVVPPGAQTVYAGSIVAIEGTMETSTYERCIEASSVTVLGSTEVPRPLFVTNKAVSGGDWRYNPVTGAGQKGAWYRVGWNNIGLLIKTCGEVVSVYQPGGLFVINDGSAGAVMNVAVLVPPGGTYPSVGDKVMVTGISSMGGSLKLRVSSDLQVVSSGTAATYDLLDGYNLICAPLVPFSYSPASVFSGVTIDDVLTRFDAVTQSNVVYDAGSPSAFGNIALGDGYWLVGPDTVSYSGYPDGLPNGSGTMTDVAVSLPGLKESPANLDGGGWHIVGQPFDHDTAVDSGSYTGDRLWLSDGATVLTWGDACMAGWCQSVLQGQNEWGGFAAGFDELCDDDHLRSSHGYWFLTAKDDLALIIPAYDTPSHPGKPVVTDDGAYTTSSTTLHASWTASGASTYSYAVGTAPERTDVVSLTSAGSSTEVSRSDLSLQDGVTYYFSVVAFDSNGQMSSAGVSDGIMADSTAPSTPVVTDDGTVTANLHASWSSSDAHSGIASYQYAVGTTSGGTDVKGWTTPSPATATEVTVTDVTLTAGQTYYFAVKATNSAGLVSGTGVSDGVKWYDVVVNTTARTARRSVMGLHYWHYGDEFWDSQNNCVRPQYEELLERWQLGSTRTNAIPRWAWDAQKTPWAYIYAQYVYTGMHAYPRDGRVLGADEYECLASVSGGDLSWVVDMVGIYDGYGNSVTDNGIRWQGGRDSCALFSWMPACAPTNDAKADWCTPADPDSLFQRAADLGEWRVQHDSGDVRRYELGNEFFSWARIPEAYWKEGESTPDRIAYGDWWGHSADSTFVVHDRLTANWCGGTSDYDMTFDWTAGNTGPAGNVLYLGFPYKPWRLFVTMQVGGQGGHLTYQHADSSGSWQSLVPTGAALGGQATSSYTTQSGTYQNLVNLKVGDGCSGTGYVIYLLPSPKDVQDVHGTNWEPYWESTGDHHTDWVRAQPTELGGQNVRKLYWLRIYADQAYSPAPVEMKISHYTPDYRDLLSTCNDLHDRIKSADEDAEVFNVGLPHAYFAGATSGFDDYLKMYWYFLKDGRFNSKWDGLVMHPYVSWRPSSDPLVTRDVVLTKVDDSAGGLLKQVDEMRALMDGDGFSDRKLICTEWGINPDEAKADRRPCTMAEALFCLEGTLELMRDRTGFGGSTNRGPDSANWHSAYPGTNRRSPEASSYSSPFYTFPALPALPDADTEYIQRPVGLAMSLMGSHYRSTAYEVACNGGGGFAKAYAFEEAGKARTMILINKTGSAKEYHLYWPSVANQTVYATDLCSQGGVLDSDNELPGAQEVELTPQTMTGTSVGPDGVFTYTVPAYSAVGLEFKSGSTDTIPPPAITGMTSSCSSSSCPSKLFDVVTQTWAVQLGWDAPTDGNGGTAAAYEIRYTTAGAITDETAWNAATRYVGLPRPHAPDGDTDPDEAFTAFGFQPDTTYYFAIKARDVENNWSAVSQFPSVTTESHRADPVEILNDQQGYHPDLWYLGDNRYGIKLWWYTPYRNGCAGWSGWYDIRASTNPIEDEEDWDSASVCCSRPAPGVPGVLQDYVAARQWDGVDCVFLEPAAPHDSVTYYFAIRTTTECGFVSALSNCVSATIPARQ